MIFLVYPLSRQVNNEYATGIYQNPHSIKIECGFTRQIGFPSLSAEEPEILFVRCAGLKTDPFKIGVQQLLRLRSSATQTSSAYDLPQAKIRLTYVPANVKPDKQTIANTESDGCPLG